MSILHPVATEVLKEYLLSGQRCSRVPFVRDSRTQEYPLSENRCLVHTWYYLIVPLTGQKVLPLAVKKVLPLVGMEVIPVTALPNRGTNCPLIPAVHTTYQVHYLVLPSAETGVEVFLPVRSEVQPHDGTEVPPAACRNRGTTAGRKKGTVVPFIGIEAYVGTEVYSTARRYRGATVLPNRNVYLLSVQRYCK